MRSEHGETSKKGSSFLAEGCKHSVKAAVFWGEFWDGYLYAAAAAKVKSTNFKMSVI